MKEAKPVPPNRGTEAEFLQQVFHLLSQPMTALQCSLEFALSQDGNRDEYRAGVESALENAERLRSRMLLVREMAEACEGGELRDSIELRSVLQETIENLGPLFDHAGEPTLRCGDVQVIGERGRMRRAFLYLIEFLLGDRETSTRRACILVEEQSGFVLIRISDGHSVEVATQQQSAISPQIEIARKTFEAAGGGLAFKQDGLGHALCEVHLLKPESPAGQARQAVAP